MTCRTPLTVLPTAKTLLSSLHEELSTPGEFFYHLNKTNIFRLIYISHYSNIGVWVGPQFQQALSSKINSLAFQGVDSDAYAADLQGYLGEGGSDGGSQALAQTVTDYTAKCPDSTVIVSGWRFVGSSPMI